MISGSQTLWSRFYYVHFTDGEIHIQRDYYTTHKIWVWVQPNLSESGNQAPKFYSKSDAANDWLRLGAKLWRLCSCCKILGLVPFSLSDAIIGKKPLETFVSLHKRLAYCFPQVKHEIALFVFPTSCPSSLGGLSHLLLSIFGSKLYCLGMKQCFYWNNGMVWLTAIYSSIFPKSAIYFTTPRIWSSIILNMKRSLKVVVVFLNVSFLHSPIH